MRRPLNLVVAVVVVIGLLLLVKLKLYDIWDQYNVPAYVQSYVGPGENDFPLQDGPPIDKVIVMAKVKMEDTTWVEENLPEYVPASCALRSLTSSQLANCDLYC